MNVLLFEGRSIIVWSALGVEFIIFIMAFISIWFRDMYFISWLICFALITISLTFLAVFLICSSRVSRFLGERSFESVMPDFFRKVSSSFFMQAPASTSGPITGPRPASSMPSMFMVLFLVMGRYINVCFEYWDYISIFCLQRGRAAWSARWAHMTAEVFCAACGTQRSMVQIHPSLYFRYLYIGVWLI